jgi:hypothetical protein
VLAEPVKGLGGVGGEAVLDVLDPKRRGGQIRARQIGALAE